MCGLVGYVGNRPCSKMLLEGLSRLEYRGYDSAGIGLLGTDGLVIRRAVGRVAALTPLVPESEHTVGLGHTRWATHGGLELRNTHPHTDRTGRVAVVHNGIIDNADALRERFDPTGAAFTSDTDTEVIAHLIADAYTGDPMAALQQAIDQLQGTWGLVVAFADHPDRLFVSRYGSPLVLGFGDDEVFIASDAQAIAPWVDQVVHLDDGDQLEIRQGMFASIASRAVPFHAADEADMGAHSCFMVKEILEQPEVLTNALVGRVSDRGVQLGCLVDHPSMRDVSSVVLLACGTSFHAASVGARLIERVAHIPAVAKLASEFSMDGPMVDPKALYIAVSQSGETYDTLEALRRVKTFGAATLGVVNTVDSSIAREADAGLFVHAGPEVAVASTKAFTAQIATLGALALGLAGNPESDAALAVREGLIALPNAVRSTLARLVDLPQVVTACRWIVDANYALFLGRGPSRHVAEEGSLKLKELSYVPCDAYAAGEMKHGPIAMITKGTPVIVVVPRDEHRTHMLANIAEVRARGARVIALCEPDDAEVARHADLVLPMDGTHALLSPVLSVLPMQFLAFRAAELRGLDVDKPRNLAKSVTVA
ncbi:MAG: glucosamine--fructose-6-phosphate aminotransferase (isomerizing) [Myxococcota bacterium]|jgi:glucosamine--fructose-6-phosphate aminotransferase (isomerizing)